MHGGLLNRVEARQGGSAASTAGSTPAFKAGKLPPRFPFSRLDHVHTTRRTYLNTNPPVYFTATRASATTTGNSGSILGSTLLLLTQFLFSRMFLAGWKERWMDCVHRVCLHSD